jgi:superfamily II DNA or RNA helicase
MKPVVLRDYQEQSIAGLRDGIRQGHRLQVLAAPAGSGKTECAAYLVAECYAKQKRSLFVVDRVNLVDQTSDRFDKYGIPHGVIQAGHWRMRLHERVQIASAQTLERRGIPEDFDLVIIDEGHCVRKQIAEYIARINAKVIALTATPFTKGMGQIYQGVVNVTTTNRLIESGHLVPLKVYAGKRADMTGAKVVAGEWRDRDIEDRGKAIIGDIVAEWVDKTHLHFGGLVKTICFSATVAHGAELVKSFRDAGYRFEQISYQDGDDTNRRALIEEFRRADSEIVGLIACEVFTKGFDVPDVRCGISARPYRKSLSSHIQQVGRVQRPADGKEFGLWLCHSGNYLRFQDDTDNIFENGVHELDDGAREEKAAKLDNNEADKKECKCKACGFVMPTGARNCPACGAERQRRCDVEVVQGQMVEVKSKLTGPLAKISKGSMWRQISQWALEKKGGDMIAARKLALAKYRDWNGCWPKSEFGDFEPVSVDVARKIQADNIKWSKRRRA